MSVIGASENRFNHGGSTETHLQQPSEPPILWSGLDPSSNKGLDVLVELVMPAVSGSTSVEAPPGPSGDPGDLYGDFNPRRGYLGTLLDDLFFSIWIFRDIVPHATRWQSLQSEIVGTGVRWRAVNPAWVVWWFGYGREAKEKPILSIPKRMWSMVQELLPWRQKVI